MGLLLNQIWAGVVTIAWRAVRAHVCAETTRRDGRGYASSAGSWSAPVISSPESIAATPRRPRSTAGSLVTRAIVRGPIADATWTVCCHAARWALDFARVTVRVVAVVGRSTRGWYTTGHACRMSSARDTGRSERSIG